MRLTRRIRQTAALALVTVVAAAPTAAAAGGDDFVLRRDGSKAVAVSVPEPAGTADEFAWGDAGIGAGAGVALLLAAGAGALVVRSRHGTRRSPVSAAGS